MSNYLLPETRSKGITSDGKSFQFETYTYDTALSLDLLKIVQSLFVFGIIAPFVSPFLLLNSFYNFKGRFQINYIICIVLSSYFLIDAYNGWLILRIIDFVFDEQSLNVIISINAGTLVSSTVLWILGLPIASVLYAIPSYTIRWLFMILLLLVTVFVGYSYAIDVVKKYPEWPMINLENGKYNKDPDAFILR